MTAVSNPPVPRWIRDQHNIARLIQTLHHSWPIVPFVGAGVSAQMGYPGWSDFLLLTAPDVMRAEIERMIQQGRFEEAAEAIFRQRGIGFQDAIEDEFYKDRRLSPASVAFCLPRLVEGPVVTTNFDNVLERVFNRVGRPFEIIALGGEGETALEAFETNSRSLIKLHGKATNHETRILTREEYQRHYCKSRSNAIDYSKPLPRAMKTLMSKATVLFIGCSLRQDKYLKVLAAAVKDTNARHYALLPQPDASELDDRKVELRAFNIHPIWYRRGRHRDIRTIVEHVAGSVDREILVPFCPAHVGESRWIDGRLMLPLDTEELDFLDIVSKELRSSGRLAKLCGTAFADLVPGFIGDRQRVFSAAKNPVGEIVLSFYPNAFDANSRPFSSIRLRDLRDVIANYWPRRRDLPPRICVRQSRERSSVMVLEHFDERSPCRISIQFI